MLKHLLLRGAFAKLSVLFLLATVITACDSNDKDNSTTASSISTAVSSVPAKNVPVTNVHFQFPPDFSSTADDTVTLRGAVLDNSDVSQVMINGNLVSSNDDFQSWEYELALLDGENSAELSYQTQSGETEVVKTLTVNRAVDIVSPRHMVVTENSALIFDQALSALIQVDLSNGQRTVLSPSPVSPDAINKIQALALLGQTEQLIYSKELSSSSASSSSTSSAPSNQSISDPLYLVSLVDGAQSSIVPTAIANHALSREASTLLVDGADVYASYDELVFIDEDSQPVTPYSEDSAATFVQSHICKINPLTGERTLFSGYGKPTLTSWGGTIFAMATSPESEYIYILELVNASRNVDPYYRIASVNKADGERESVASVILDVDPAIAETYLPEIVAGDDDARFEITFNPITMKLDFANDRLLLLNNNHIVALSLSEKTARVVLPEEYQPGPILITTDFSSQSSSSSASSLGPLDYRLARPITIDLDTNELSVLAIDDSFDRLVSVDLESGARSFKAGTGSDDPQNQSNFRYISGLSIHEESNTLLVADRLRSDAFLNNLGSLEKTSLMAENFSDLPVLAIDAELGRSNQSLFFVDNFNQKPALPRNYSRFNPKIYRLSASDDISEGYDEISLLYAFNSSSVAIKNIEVSYDEQTIYALYHLAQSPEQVRNFQGILKISRIDDEVIAETLPRRKQSDSDVLYSSLRDMALMESEGKLVGVDAILNAVFTIDINGGKQTLVSGFDASKDINLSQPVAVLPYDNNQSVLVLDTSLDAVVKINLATDEREIFIDNVEGSYDNFINASTMALHETFDYLLIGDDTRDAIIAVDLKTKEKVRYLR